jgi:hypothetical protein
MKWTQTIDPKEYPNFKNNAKPKGIRPSLNLKTSNRKTVMKNRIARAGKNYKRQA